MRRLVVRAGPSSAGVNGDSRSVMELFLSGAWSLILAPVHVGADAPDGERPCNAGEVERESVGCTQSGDLPRRHTS